MQAIQELRADPELLEQRIAFHALYLPMCDSLKKWRAMSKGQQDAKQKEAVEAFAKRFKALSAKLTGTSTSTDHLLHFLGEFTNASDALACPAEQALERRQFSLTVFLARRHAVNGVADTAIFSAIVRYGASDSLSHHQHEPAAADSISPHQHGPAACLLGDPEIAGFALVSRALHGLPAVLFEAFQRSAVHQHLQNLGRQCPLFYVKYLKLIAAQMTVSQPRTLIDCRLSF